MCGDYPGPFLIIVIIWNNPVVPFQETYDSSELVEVSQAPQNYHVTSNYECGHRWLVPTPIHPLAPEPLG